MEREKWINDVLDSTKGMHRAEPSPFLFEQVIAKIKSDTHQIEYSTQGSSSLRWGLAVFVSLIIMFNMVFIVKDNLSKNQGVNEGNAIGQSYFNNATTYTY